MKTVAVAGCAIATRSGTPHWPPSLHARDQRGAQNLEQYLGLALFERRGHRLTAKSGAQYFVAEATSILERPSTASSSLKSLRAGEIGSLNIATMPEPSAFFVRALSSQANGDNTDMRVSLSSRGFQQIQELVGAQSVDFGFGDYAPPVHHTPQCDAYHIEANCLCVLTRHHPLTRFNSISINSLERAPRRTVQRRNGQPDFSALATIC